ncbi:MAG TPA: S9 family peptidase [Thermomicrobiales bacterium]|nr:S9 family peptidase [Thermomicrobiales bacterium]
MTSTPVTIEEIVDRVVPADPRISPDGRHIAFTAATSGRKGKRHDRAIWLSTDGAPARRFTGGNANNRDPRWSPDGARLAFIAEREGDDDARLYVLPIDGGEAQKVGDLKGALSTPQWSPDGTTIAVLRTDPDNDAEKKRKEEKDDPVVFEVDDKLTRLWLVDAETGQARCLTHGKRTVWDYGWSPDGDSLIVVTTDVPTFNEAYRHSELRVVPATGGVSSALASFRNLPESPVIRTVDGEPVVAFIGNDHRADPSPAVWTVPLAGGTPRKLTPNERAVTHGIVADPSSDDGLIIVQGEGAHARVYRLSATTGALCPLVTGEHVERGSVTSVPSIASTGDLAVIWTAIDTPEEVYRVHNGSATPVTAFGEAFRDRLAGGEVVTWASTDGVEIEGILVHPCGYEEGTRYPLVVQVHGGPAWAWLDRLNMSWHDWAQQLAAKGFAVLLPNPRGSVGYGSAFEQLLQDDVGGGEAQDLISGARAMVDRGIADQHRLGIAGWSWGGYLAAWTITQTDLFRAAVVGAGVANLVSDHGAGDIAEYNTLIHPDHPYQSWDIYADRSPVRHASRVSTPTLIVHGENDTRVSVTQGQEFYRALQVCGVETQFVRYPREGHGFQEYRHQIDLLRRIEAWLTTHLQ